MKLHPIIVFMVTKPTNPLEEIQKLQAQIASLKDSAIAELRARKSAIEEEIHSIDDELEKLTGKPAGSRRGRRLSDTPLKRSLTFQELKDMLLSTPSRTLNIRKEGLDITNIRTLANINARDLTLGGKGPWPTVSYVGK